MCIRDRYQRRVHGHPHPEGVAWNINEFAAHGRFVLPHPLPYHHKPPGLGPPKELHRELSHRMVFIDHRPGFDAGAATLEGGGHPRHDDIRQFAHFQESQQRLLEKPAIRPYTPNPSAFGQQGQGFLQEGHHPAGGAGVAAAQPAMQNEGCLGQYRQERMVALATFAAWIVTLGRAFLRTFPTEYRRIQIQREAPLDAGQQAEHPAPEGTPPCTLR
eukprot:TRINITY_DN11299_c0_g1_i2.p2 TRINITY_DN11299_c0_g1~~TRINITY_DN11299_c0_g1_i2.p2  ORF type:complete len:216 (+),score=16.39 TRINITY_DN11299_c0_g1_i2:196-843(+)